jgi:peptide chain release factor subunit 1
MGSNEGLPRGLTALNDIDIRSLADEQDPRDVHLSIYLPTATGEDERSNETFVATRVKAIRDALVGENEEDFEDTLLMVEDLLFHDPIPGERGRIFFASANNDLLRAYRIGLEPERLLVLDNSPFIMPLAKLMDDYEDFGIILMDSQQAKLYSVRSKVLDQVETQSIDLMNRHKKGGMSQKRFNRLRRGQIRSFIGEIVDDVDRLDDLGDLRGLVVAGPGIEKKQLVEALPKHLRDKVIGTVDVPMDVTQSKLLAHGEAVASVHEREKETGRLEELRSAIYKDRLAAVGVHDVRDALISGRVDTLLVLEDLSIPGWICEGCKAIQEGPEIPRICPECGGPTSGAELVEEIYEMAKRTDAEVEAIPSSSFLASLGGLGAILRY